MKKIYKVSSIVIALSCALNFTTCSKNIVKAASDIDIQDDSSSEIDAYESSVEVNDELSTQVDIIAEDDSINRIVAPGYEAVEAYLDEQWDLRSFQGVALVAQGNEIKFAKAYGYADADDNIENILTTRFAIASNTKQFTAAAIMQLVEQGKVNLDDTIDKYFPEYKDAGKITVRELLQMRSGIVDYLNDPIIYMQDEESLRILDDYRNKAYFDEYVSDARWSADVILNNLYLSELQFEPGQAYDYCNTNYYLLGLIIEQVSGISYENYLEENIFKPCMMQSTSMVAEESDAKGHGSAESGEIVVNPQFTFAAGNIYSNVYDLLRWERMFHKGDIVSESSYNEMVTPSIDSGYGLGLIISDGIIRHSGVIDGFNSYTEYDQYRDITIIVLENYDPSLSLLEAKYEGAMIRGLIE